MPKTPMMAMLYPAYWAFWRSHDAIELNMRDPRIFLGCLSALAIIAIHTPGWLKRPKLPLHSGEYISLYLAIVYLVSFILWEKLWSIYRYLAIQEALSGTLVLAALILLFGKRMKSVWMAGIFVASAAAAMATTEYPWWSQPSAVRKPFRSASRRSSRTPWCSFSIHTRIHTWCRSCRRQRGQSASTATLSVPAAPGNCRARLQGQFKTTKDPCGEWNTPRRYLASPMPPWPPTR